ncbi:hypothetical protein [Legionella yabuuchiae]|uniref:hypothetical protein n=1 Tax=Legionella yabuuchiae TaxID=376727 RepID=UPI001055562C|nr:hypothetical protein [Legionella yabuuchiae]
MKNKVISNGIILFWAFWFSLVSLSDFTNFLQRFGIVSPNFSFSSKNYSLVVKTLSVYHLQYEFLSLTVFFY